MLKVFSLLVQIRTLDLLTITQGGDHSGTWCHPQITIHAAQWISPQFAVQVTKWVYELATTGQVTLDQETAQAELDDSWKIKCQDLETQLKIKSTENHQISRKYERLKERRTWYKFKVDQCFYITLNLNQKTSDFKFGITENINSRLATYRTNAPYTKLLYLVYVGQHELLEKLIKWEYKINIQPVDHEFLINTEYMNVITRIEEIMRYHSIPYKVEENMNLYNRDIEDDFNNEVQSRNQ